MKNLGLIIMVMFLFLNLSAQTDQEIDRKALKKDIRAARKEEKKKLEQQKAEVVGTILENKQFVLEADYLTNHSGTRRPVTSTINFILVDTSYTVIQVGNNWSMGHNGLGGVTAEGRITKYELHKNEKKNNYTLRMYVTTSVGMYDLFFHIGPLGNADATITGLGPGSLRYTGDIVPLQASRVHKGSTTY